jgi:hypothetical protein
LLEQDGERLMAEAVVEDLSAGGRHGFLFCRRGP